MLAQMQLRQRSYDAAIAAVARAVKLNPSDANRRELADAYDRKKKAQSGTGGRIAMEKLRLQRVFLAGPKQYAPQPPGRLKGRNDHAQGSQGPPPSLLLHGVQEFPG